LDNEVHFIAITLLVPEMTQVYIGTTMSIMQKRNDVLSVAMQKALVGIFSDGKKLGSTQSYNFKMKLPVKNGTPDYEKMCNKKRHSQWLHRLAK